jgi:hypothetical protein
LIRRKQVLRELMLDGVISVVDKVNPRVFEAEVCQLPGRSRGSGKSGARRPNEKRQKA